MKCVGTDEPQEGILIQDSQCFAFRSSKIDNWIGFGARLVVLAPGLIQSVIFAVKMAAVLVVVVAVGLIHMRTAQMRRLGTDDPGPIPIYSMMSLFGALAATACGIWAFA